jgi:hypothetical protein
MQHVEQLDIFAYMEELEAIELQESLSLAMEDQTTEDRMQLVFIPRGSFISRFLVGLKWFLSSFPNLFGLIQWVNVYTVSRAYGGPEAGGWYYRKFSTVESRQVWFWNAEALRMMLLRRFSGLAWGIISFESLGQEVTVLIEQQKAAQQTSTKPPYEQERVIGILSPAHSKEVQPTIYLRLVDPVKPQPRKQSKDEQKPASITELPKKVINKMVGYIVTLKKVTCDRCKGTGQTSYLHVQHGICFKCKGSGSLERKTS